MSDTLRDEVLARIQVREVSACVNYVRESATGVLGSQQEGQTRQAALPWQKSNSADDEETLPRRAGSP